MYFIFLVVIMLNSLVLKIIKIREVLIVKMVILLVCVYGIKKIKG